ncbi:MAG: glycoside hydrolase family 3 protein [Tenericutes bacterium]|jgi:beta-N-acetylhexosaminidase|nr:glycoside hydrolase family 3 protein [Mycoplasmatota bacterium]
MIDYDINKLSLEEKIGQLIVFGFDALTINDHAIQLIKKYKAGNVILFARNIDSPEQLFKLNQNLQKLALETYNIPLFICIDQEGGMVSRIKKGGTFFPGAMTIAASHNPKNSYLSGKLMGEELKALGINMNLAPSLDVNNNPHNPVIGVRSYSDDIEIVNQYGIENIKGLQENVIATAKHFPGHGDTTIDSHLDLPKIDKDFAALEKLELVPFKTAISFGVKAIMSSHINFPAITEDGLPTTLSHNCLTGLLRNKLNFSGLIITDCMQMKAIQTYYTTKKGTLMAIEAGANLVCISHSSKLQIEAIEYVTQSVKNHELSMSIIDERVKRVLESKKENVNLNIDGSYQDVKAIVEIETSKDFALSVVREGLTLVQGKPVSLEQKTLLIASEPISTTIADEDDGQYSIIKAVNKELPNLNTMKVSVELSSKEIDKIIKKTKEYGQVIFCSYNANIYHHQKVLIKKLNDILDLHVIAMRNPYDSFFVKKIKNLTLLYEYTPNSIKVLIEYLKKETTPQGVCPVRL